MVKRSHILVGMLFVASLIITACESTQETTLERNKALVRRVNEEVWNKGNLEMVDEMFSVDFVQHFLPDGSETKGFNELRDHIRNHRMAFPDWTEKIKPIVAEGDFVAIQFTSTGANKGNFFGNPPTGKQIQIDEMAIFRIVDGKIVEQWLLPDLLSLNQQLGLISE